MTIGTLPASAPSRRARRLLASAAALAAAASFAAPALAQYKQAPMLDQAVADKKLPPVAERLPEKPFVEKPVQSVGKYGGTLRTTILANGDHYNLTRTVANETIVRWTPDWSEVVPSIAESFTASPDATTYTFKLRKGMRWSDGTPFTADDIMFWYEDVFLSPELTPSKNPIFVLEGKPVVVTKLGDYEVQFKFAAPYGLFLQQLAYGQGHIPIIYPKHYLKQFHAKYNEAGIKTMLAESQTVKDWVSLFNSKVSLTFQPAFWQNLDLPTLNPWLLTTAYGPTDRVAVVRNPYYWKVDTAGNQLPYIDRITWQKIDDVQLMLLKATTGEFDFSFRHINNSTFKSVLYDNQKQGKYRFFDVKDLPANDAVILLNLNVNDPVKRKVFQNKDFRIALSHAINRQEIIDLIYVGRGTPSQVAVHKGHELYNERLSKQYVEYDPKKSNEILDKIGLDKKDSEGYRLGPDGKRFSIVFMVADVFGSSYPDVMLQVQKYAKAVGIDIQLRNVDRARLNTMWYANEHEAYIWNCVGGLSEAYTDVRCYMPFQKADIFFAMKWSEWYSDPKTGEEPPPEVKASMALYDKVKSASTKEAQLTAMKAFLETAADNFYTIGITHPDPKYGIVGTSVKNVFEPLPITGNLWHPAPTLTQFYFDR
ncbi:ABC transporter substrate-binding protein [Prosthecomicrobium sp. N25]|uniref:ABC transporter substrate-binding protein n=1 Tax=Prosthecomicrobium sp. N25 TaxID=3129254 RepID=UPI003077495A